jgi:hypothetical protein
MSLTPLQRINRIIAFYYKRGTNKESVNKVHRKILSIKFKDSKYYENQFKPKDYGRHNNV